MIPSRSYVERMTHSDFTGLASVWKTRVNADLVRRVGYTPRIFDRDARKNFPASRPKVSHIHVTRSGYVQLALAGMKIASSRS